MDQWLPEEKRAELLEKTVVGAGIAWDFSKTVGKGIFRVVKDASNGTLEATRSVSSKVSTQATKASNAVTVAAGRDLGVCPGSASSMCNLLSYFVWSIPSLVGWTAILVGIGTLTWEWWKREFRFRCNREAILQYFEKKSIMITGATSGMGEALAYRLASSKYSPSVMYLHGRNMSRLQEVIDVCEGFQTGVKLVSVLVDLGDPDKAYHVVKGVFAEGNASPSSGQCSGSESNKSCNDSGPKQLDILFSNAGVSQRDTFQNLSTAPITAIMNANILSTMMIVKAVLPSLLLKTTPSTVLFNDDLGVKAFGNSSKDAAATGACVAAGTAAGTSESKVEGKSESKSSDLSSEANSTLGNSSNSSSSSSNALSGTTYYENFTDVNTGTSTIHRSTSATTQLSSDNPPSNVEPSSLESLETYLLGRCNNYPTAQKIIAKVCTCSGTVQKLIYEFLRSECVNSLRLKLGFEVSNYYQKEPKKHIVHVSSFTGRVAFGFRTIYSASKFAGTGFYTSLQSELYDQGVRVSLIFPGFIRTNISKSALTSAGEKFAANDAKIENGLCPNIVVDRMLAAVYYEDQEVEVMNNWEMSFQAYFARVSTYAHRYFALTNCRDQIKMAEEAKKEVARQVNVQVEKTM